MGFGDNDLPVQFHLIKFLTWLVASFEVASPARDVVLLGALLVITRIVKAQFNGQQIESGWVQI